MDQSQGIKPFCFDTEFSVVPQFEDGPITEGALAITAMRAQIEAMRADHSIALTQARDDAFREGLNHARAEREQALLDTIATIHDRWEDFADLRDTMAEQLRTEACALARAIGEALAGRALGDDPTEAIDQAIRRVLAQIARGQEVQVNVHPDLVAEVETRIAHHQSQDRRRLYLVVQADTSLALGDAHLRWDSGGLRLDAQARAAAIADELETLGVGGRYEHEQYDGTEELVPFAKQEEES